MKFKKYPLDDFSEENIAFVKFQFSYCMDHLFSIRNNNVIDQVEKTNPYKDFLNNRDVWEYVLKTSPELFDGDFKKKIKNINCNLFDYELFEFIFESVLINNILSFSVEDKIKLYDCLYQQYKNDLGTLRDKKNHDKYFNEISNFFKIVNHNDCFSTYQKEHFLFYMLQSININNIKKEENSDLIKIISLNFNKINLNILIEFMEIINNIKDEGDRNYCFKKLLSKENEMNYFYYFLLDINQEVANIIFDKIDVNRFEEDIQDFLESNLDYSFDKELDDKIKEIWSFYENYQKQKLLSILKEDIDNSKKSRRKI